MAEDEELDGAAAVKGKVEEEAKNILDKLNNREKPKEADSAAAPSGEVAQPNLRKGRIIIIGAAAIILLAIIGGIVSWLMNRKPAAPVHKLETQIEKPIFLDLDDFIVNLSSSDGKSRFLKMAVSLELKGDEEKNIIIASMPKIRDTFQVYLRELRAEDLRGSESLFRLREELLFRINKMMYPIVVKDILFNEVLVQ